MTALWRDNPVLTKELRVRMRGARAYWILTGYLAFLSLILFFQYMGWWNETVRQGSGYTGSSRIGQQFFYWIAGVQAFLVAFITPAVTSGAITVEKEQRTLEMLEMTRLPSSAIVAGKLFSAVGFVGLLLVSSLPLTCLCFFLGGVSPQQVIMAYLLLFCGSFVTGALGLVWSSVAASTTAAVVYTYASLIVPLILFVVFLGSMSARGVYDDQIACALAMGLYGIPWPDTMGYLSSFFAAWDMRHFYGLTLPVWLGPGLTYALIGLTLCAAATMRLSGTRTRNDRWVKLLLALVFVQQLFFYFGGRFFVYSAAAPPGLAAQLAPYSLLTMLFYPVALLLLCVPIFSTVETPQDRPPRSAAPGIAYLVLLITIIFGMYWVSMLISRTSGAAVAATGAGAGVIRPIPITPRGAMLASVPNAITHNNALPVAAAVLASLAGMSAVAWLCSVAMRNRWAAMVFTYGMLALIMVVPAVARATYLSDTTAKPSILINLLYLNPMSTLVDATGMGRGYQGLPMVFSGTPVWIVTTVTYAVIALVAAVAGMMLANRRALRRVHAV
jgi:ABC-type transport system involved in multi-copper enzyme maturation permease subunit